MHYKNSAIHTELIMHSSSILVVILGKKGTLHVVYVMYSKSLKYDIAKLLHVHANVCFEQKYHMH